MKRLSILVLFLSVLAALGLALAVVPVLADGGALEVAFSSSPRFPVVGEEAVLTFKISHNGSIEQGQEVMVMLSKTAAGGHGHESANNETAAPAGGGGAMPANMPGMNHGAPVAEPVPMEHLIPVETSPGVYVAKHTFEQGGKYVATVQVLDDEADVIVAVRSSPIAWPYIIGLAGISALLAGVVAVVKTVRKEW